MSDSVLAHDLSRSGAPGRTGELRPARGIGPLAARCGRLALAALLVALAGLALSALQPAATSAQDPPGTTLSDITVDGTSVVDFDAATTTYTVGVANAVAAVTVVGVATSADATVACLDKAASARGRGPEFLRCDNGPELTANALRDWCRLTSTKTSYIEPGSPWQNPWVESYGSRMRDELLAIEQFDSLLEAQVLVADWRDDYNYYRPHSALGMLTPAEYADQWAKNNPNKLS